jgi:hypothetical protein
MTPWVAQLDDVTWDRTREVKVAVSDSDPVNARILKLATDLGNTVLAKKAANDLQASVISFYDIEPRADIQTTVSRPGKYQALADQRSFTKSCKFWKLIILDFQHADSFWTSSTSGSLSRLF